MATDFKYATIPDLNKYFNRVSDFDSKVQIFPTLTSGNLHLFRDSGYVSQLFVNGEELAAAQSTSGDVDSNGEWFYASATNQVEYYNSNYSSTTINEQVFEAGVDFTDFLNQTLIDASLELHNYIDMRYSTPLMPSKQIDITTTPVDILEEYDPIIIKSVCYIAAANLIRAKEGSSEEADYYHSLVTNQDRTGIIDKLNDGIYKLSSEIDANDKNGKILARLNVDTMDLIELTGEYTGERYDLLKVVSTTGGAYGTAKFQVSYLSNDQLEGKTTDPEVITGGLQHIFSGLYGRFQGSSTNSNSTWYIEVYDKGVKVTNKSNKTIEMRR
jgi:phage gp36-like protein|tara:strand:- start:5674 stop:6657 length:984 start_codon:yes stop_codon:yes gene_type:complete